MKFSYQVKEWEESPSDSNAADMLDGISNIEQKETTLQNMDHINVITVEKKAKYNLLFYKSLACFLEQSMSLVCTNPCFPKPAPINHVFLNIMQPRLSHCWYHQTPWPSSGYQRVLQGFSEPLCSVSTALLFFTISHFGVKKKIIISQHQHWPIRHKSVFTKES